MKISRIKVEVALHISTIDGIGIEVFYNNVFILDIFRNDAKKTKEITLFKKILP